MNFNYATKQVRLKIAYLGTPGAGRRTTIEALHRMMETSWTGKLVTLEDPGISSRQFEFSLGDHWRDFEVVFHLDCQSGPAHHARGKYRSLAVKGVDGIVFAVDCRPGRVDENSKELQRWPEVIDSLGSVPSGIPLVLQFNRFDLLGGEALDDLQAAICPANGALSFPTNALTGEGLVETFHAIARRALFAARRRMRKSQHRAGRGPRPI